MKVKRLRPEPPPVQELAQCEAETQKMKHWYRPGGYMDKRRADCKVKGWNPELCLRFATHEVDGKKLCSLHAGKVALAAMKGK